MPKDYLQYENARNKKYAALYTKLIKLAFGEKNAVLVGHHITFEYDGDLATENEVPSADSLIFDHDIMQAVFGDNCIRIMQHLATVDCEQRDDVLLEYCRRAGIME